MKLFTKFKRFAKAGLIAGVAAASVLGATLATGHSSTVEAATSCDKVNIIYCGLTGSTLSNQIASFKSDYDKNTSGQSYKDVQIVYNYVGANKTLVDGMSTTNTVSGAVQRNGDVVAGGKVIATNAYVAARFSVAGAKLIPGTNAYLRATTSSFAHASEPAIIREDANGKMLFAAIIGCGNAVKATPVPTPTPKPVLKPNYSVNKEVALKGTSTYTQDLSVKAGSHVVYKITYASTGNTPVTAMVVHDVLPAGVQYQAGTLARDGAALTSTQTTNFFGAGLYIGTFKNGTTMTFTFEAVVGPTDTPSVCTPASYPNKAYEAAPGLPTLDSTATVNKACLPKPTLACVSLTATPGTPDTTTGATPYTLVAKSNPSNVTVTSYVFNFNNGVASQTVTSSANTVTVPHTFAVGSWTVNVTVNGKDAAGNPLSATNANCATSFTVKVPECKPGVPVGSPQCQPSSLVCVGVTATPGVIDTDGSQTYSFTTQATASNATITEYAYDFGDNNVVKGTSATATHKFAPGNWTTTVTVSGTDASGNTIVAAATANCTKQVTVKTPECKPGVPANSSACYTCDQFTATLGANRTVTVKSFSATPVASLTSVTVNWGDNTSDTYTPATSAVGQTHQYTADKQYTIVASANFNSQDTPVVTSDNCKQVVTFTATPTPPTPSTPSVLPSTGAGSVVGLFGASAVFATIAHRLFLARRLSRQS